MPIYEFQCSECGLQFEKIFRRISEDLEHPCENCQAPAKKMVSAVSFQFAHKTGVRGAAPSSTGTSDDWNYDKTIGRDAARKWEEIERRNTNKDSVIRDERKAGRVISRNHLVPKTDGSGEYRVMSEPERVRTNTNREAAFKIAKEAAPKNSDSE